MEGSVPISSMAMIFLMERLLLRGVFIVSRMQFRGIIMVLESTSKFIEFNIYTYSVISEVHFRRFIVILQNSMLYKINFPKPPY